MPRIHAAARPVTAEVTATPAVASASAGFQATLRAALEVRSPQSKRIKARATVPMPLASA